MRCLIFSDLHGSEPALEFILKKSRELAPDMLILLGDLVYHGPRNPLPMGYNTPDILARMPELASFPFPVTAVRGNCDAEVDVALMPFEMPASAWLELDGLGIFASHGHHLPDRPPFPRLPAGTVVLRGHTHIPRAETLDGYRIWNPGSISLPKGGFPPSYGIFQDGKFEVLDTSGNVLMSERPGLC